MRAIPRMLIAIIGGTEKRKEGQPAVLSHAASHSCFKNPVPGSRARIRGASTEYFEKYETLFLLCLSLH